jgi:hypothetical protein
MILAYYGAQYINQWWCHLLIFLFVMCHTTQALLYTPLPSFIFGILGAYLLTDVVSGFLHYATEFFPNDNWKLPQHGSIAEQHHTDVLNYADFTFGERLAFSYGFQVPFIFLIFFATPGTQIYAMLTLCLWMSYSIAFVHDWAHRRQYAFSVPWIVEKLQDWEIIMTPQHHNLHHFVNSSQWYGFFHGHTDRLTNYLFWKPKKYDETFPLERMRMIGRKILQRKTFWKENGSIDMRLLYNPDLP